MYVSTVASIILYDMLPLFGHYTITNDCCTIVLKLLGLPRTCPFDELAFVGIIIASSAGWPLSSHVPLVVARACSSVQCSINLLSLCSVSLLFWVQPLCMHCIHRSQLHYFEHASVLSYVNSKHCKRVGVNCCMPILVNLRTGLALLCLFI
jgi:hypothetical protein